MLCPPLLAHGQVPPSLLLRCLETTVRARDSLPPKGLVATCTLAVRMCLHPMVCDLPGFSLAVEPLVSLLPVQGKVVASDDVGLAVAEVASAMARSRRCPHLLPRTLLHLVNFAACKGACHASAPFGTALADLGSAVPPGGMGPLHEQLAATLPQALLEALESRLGPPTSPLMGPLVAVAGAHLDLTGLADVSWLVHAVAAVAKHSRTAPCPEFRTRLSLREVGPIGKAATCDCCLERQPARVCVTVCVLGG
jgi:hypothetical protein